MLDNEYPVDLSEIKHVIKTADVMLIRFPLFDKRLLLDARFDEEEGPMMRVVPRVGSAAERFRSLKKLRPRFPLPKNIVSFTWPKHVASLESLGVWDAIVERIQRAGFADSDQECRDTFTELLKVEHHEIISAITGEGYETIWERKKS
ncbi:MAG: hypothetical protein HYY02_10920 [Chloroflexi bacterium]|nr:hypothetical protein [Chloroflexota bacterium]